MPDRLTGLRDYAAAVRDLRDGSAARLAAYGRRAHALVPADAQARFARIDASAPAAEAPLPDVRALAQIPIAAETRFSLLLAALLDPARTLGLADWLWPRLLDRVEAEAERTGRLAHVRCGLEACRALDRRHLEVTPTRHGREWNNIDVFARVVDRGTYRGGLVVENKVHLSTAEQPRQLERYWRCVRRTWPGAERRTVFVFLTRHAREARSAGVAADVWVPLRWRQIARILRDAGEAGALSPEARTLPLHAADALRAAGLGGPTADWPARELRRLRWLLADRADDDLLWRRLHPDLCRLARRLAGASRV